ncbi:hypothetical protein [Natrarchaeobaculum aegyptiacum]|uniref:Uncharacterized protein n=1 Tax=Natrarchaeobaculum aegyptiacum TaxID=745377 RepID=A0A2Z2HX89_9EURY|nr:hypothetical protein [Natrarchaeobaculum aegyptiacum]ARS89574.1 hypothetical protein B1756_07355 [Natrarchaeobaculum aegyptiacum]
MNAVREATSRSTSATRERLALHTAAGLTVTAVGIVAYQVLTVGYGDSSPVSVGLGLGLLALSLTAGVTRRLWLVAAGYLAAIPLLLLFAVGLMIPMGDPTPPPWVIDAWWLSIVVMVAGIAVAMLAISYHVAVRLVDYRSRTAQAR